MATLMARRKGICVYARHFVFVCMGSIMHDLVNSRVRNFISRFKFIGHNFGWSPKWVLIIHGS